MISLLFHCSFDLGLELEQNAPPRTNQLLLLTVRKMNEGVELDSVILLVAFFCRKLAGDAGEEDEVGE